MQIRQTDRLSIAPPIRAADVADIAAAGFCAIICNSPDGKRPDQPTRDEMAGAAEPPGSPSRPRCEHACLTSTVEVTASWTAARWIEVPFDTIHVCPPQVSPDLVRVSPLADAAGFGCGRLPKPFLPAWLTDGARPSRLAWLMKERRLSPVCWRGMLRKRAWMATPEPVAAPEA